MGSSAIVPGRIGARPMPRQAVEDLPFEWPDEKGAVDTARTRIAVMEKGRFVLDRCAAAPEAEDERLQKFIRRALGGMDRLRERGERK